MKVVRVFIYFVIVIGAFFYNFYLRPVPGNPMMTEDYKASNSYINNLYQSDEFFKKNVIPENKRFLYETMLEDIQNGVEEREIKCDHCQGDYTTVYEALYLDHPELLSFQSAISYVTDDDIHIKYHNLGKLKSTMGAKRIEREIEIVQKETKDMDQKDKIIYVYNYVAGHDYDKMFMYSSSNQSAYSFFTKGTSVCAGFAKASQILFQNIGIKSYLAIDEDHMWNYVEYEGKYYIFDATVGASYHNKKNRYFYEGLGRTTTGETMGFFKEHYPKIEEQGLKEIFGLK